MSCSLLLVLLLSRRPRDLMREDGVPGESRRRRPCVRACTRDMALAVALSRNIFQELWEIFYRAMYRDDLSRPASAKVIMENVSPSPSAKLRAASVRRLRSRSLAAAISRARSSPLSRSYSPHCPPPRRSFFFFFSSLARDGLDRRAVDFESANVIESGTGDEAPSLLPPRQRFLLRGGRVLFELSSYSCACNV